MNTDTLAALAVLRHGIDLLETALAAEQPAPTPAPPPEPAPPRPAPPTKPQQLVPWLHGGDVVHLTFDEHRVAEALEDLADDDGVYRGGQRGLEVKARMGHDLISACLVSLSSDVDGRPPLIRRVAGPRGRHDFAVIARQR